MNASRVSAAVQDAGAVPASTGTNTVADHEPLDALVAEALEQHPRVAVARHVAAAADEVPSRVGAMPDPWLTVAGQNLRIDSPLLRSSPMSAVQVGLMQGIPFPGKLKRRKAVAEAAAERLDRTTDVVAAEIALRVRRAYWELHFAQRALEITAESERIFDTLVNVAIERFAVGIGAQQDSLQAEVAHSQLRADLEMRTQAVMSACRVLNAAVGRPPEASFGATASPTPAALASRKFLRERLENASPVLVERRAATLVADRAVAEARYDRWPDLQAGLAWRFRAVVMGDASNGADMLVGSLGVSLPFWMGRKQNARVREATLMRSAAEAAVEAAELDVSTELERLVDVVERLDGQLRIYDREIVPQATGALDASIGDYQVDKVGFVSVLRNWEVELSTRLMRERLSTERAVREAEIIALIGSEPR